MRRTVCLLLVLVVLLSGGIVDLCRCAPSSGVAVATVGDGAPTEPCGGCCEPAAPSCCCAAPADEAIPAGDQDLVADRRCDCPVVELGAPAAEPVVDAARDLERGASSPSLALAPPVDAALDAPLADRRPRGLGPPPDPGRPRHLLLHVLRC